MHGSTAARAKQLNAPMCNIPSSDGTTTRFEPMNDTPFENSELHLFNAVLEQVCKDLQISDEAKRSSLRDSIFVLAREGVRDFETLRNYATRPRINRFSMVDPA
jgi:hypothetical protein